MRLDFSMAKTKHNYVFDFLLYDPNRRGEWHLRSEGKWQALTFNWALTKNQAIALAQKIILKRYGQYDTINWRQNEVYQGSVWWYPAHNKA